ncbi:MAG: hypothetical protein ACR2KZ_17650 [Segetibacter sp.]
MKDFFFSLSEEVVLRIASINLRSFPPVIALGTSVGWVTSEAQAFRNTRSSF